MDVGVLLGQGRCSLFFLRSHYSAMKMVHVDTCLRYRRTRLPLRMESRMVSEIVHVEGLAEVYLGRECCSLCAPRSRYGKHFDHVRFGVVAETLAVAERMESWRCTLFGRHQVMKWTGPGGGVLASPADLEEELSWSCSWLINEQQR